MTWLQPCRLWNCAEVILIEFTFLTVLIYDRKRSWTWTICRDKVESNIYRCGNKGLEQIDQLLFQQKETLEYPFKMKLLLRMLCIYLARLTTLLWAMSICYCPCYLLPFNFCSQTWSEFLEFNTQYFRSFFSKRNELFCFENRFDSRRIFTDKHMVVPCMKFVRLSALIAPLRAHLPNTFVKLALGL